MPSLMLLLSAAAIAQSAAAHSEPVRSVNGAGDGARAQIKQPANEQSAPDQAPAMPVVVELFTSQSCSYCPAAEAYLNSLAARNDVIALQWHVDYWNDYVDGRNGQWRDPFSNAAFSQRQANYNKSIRGRKTTFTPQIVVNGAKQANGAHVNKIDRYIQNADTPNGEIAAQAFDDRIEFKITASPADLLLVRFHKEMETDIKSGKNRGKKLMEAHIVSVAESVGSVETGETTISVDPPMAGYGCALLVQEREVGAILAAAYCPAL